MTPIEEMLKTLDDAAKRGRAIGLRNMIAFYESEDGIAAYERGLANAKAKLEACKAELAKIESEAS